MPCSLLFRGGWQCVVTCHKQLNRNQWVRVRLNESDTEAVDAAANTEAEHRVLEGELVEIIGPVGDQTIELHAYLQHYAVLPCNYPPMCTWALRPQLDLGRIAECGRTDCRSLYVFSLDRNGTRVIDDALSFEFEDDLVHENASSRDSFLADSSANMNAFDASSRCRIGVHVTDVASRIPVCSSLFRWASQRPISVGEASPFDLKVTLNGHAMPTCMPVLGNQFVYETNVPCRHWALSIPPPHPPIHPSLSPSIEHRCMHGFKCILRDSRRNRGNDAARQGGHGGDAAPDTGQRRTVPGGGTAAPGAFPLGRRAGRRGGGPLVEQDGHR